jgi:WD40 repeat protein
MDTAGRGKVTAVATGPDGILLLGAAPSGEGLIEVWNLVDREFIGWLDDAEPENADGRDWVKRRGYAHSLRTVSSLAYVPDDHTVVAGSIDGFLRVWNLTTLSLLDTIQTSPAPELDLQSRAIQSPKFWKHLVAVTRQGGFMVTSTLDGELKVWDRRAKSNVYRLQTRSDDRPVEDSDDDWFYLGRQDHEVTALALSPDDRYVLSGASDGTVKIWHMQRIPGAKREGGHTQWVNTVVFSPGDAGVISGSDDGWLKRWDLHSGTELQSVRAHEGWVLGMAFTPDGRLMTASADTTLKLWEPTELEELAVLRGHKAQVSGVASISEIQAISASADHTLRVWDLKALEPVQILRGHKDRVIGVAASPDGRCAISCSADTTLRVWDLGTGQTLHVLRGHTEQVDGVAVAPDGSWAISTSYDGTLHIWDLATGETIRVLRGHMGKVQKVVLVSGGRYALSVSTDRTLRAWDVANGVEIARLALESELGSIALDETESMVVVGDGSGNVVCMELTWPVVSPLRPSSGPTAKTSV